MSDLYIKFVEGKGRGVFSNEPIPKDTIIEFCPVIILPSIEKKYIDHTKLYDYYFLWGNDQDDMAIALGYGSLYNHSYKPNAYYETYFEEKIIVIKSLRHIDAHEEICISYNQDPDDQRQVWFDRSNTETQTDHLKGEDQ